MADLVVTAASVQPTTTSQITRGTAGATVTAGQSVYFDSTTSTWKLGLANGTAAQSGNGGAGVSLHGASSGQPLSVVTGGDYNPGATAVIGTAYYVSKNAPGGICPEADLVSTNFPTFLGIATTAGNIKLQPLAGGVAKA